MEGSNDIVIDIENQHDPLEISMRQELYMSPALSPLRCIYRVPKRLREGKDKAYTPQLVSIGPLHHDDDHLKAMEEHKMRYVRDFLRRNEVSLESCIKKVRAQDENLRNCYAEHIVIERDKFVRLVLVDTLFVIEFLLRFVSKEFQKDDDYIFGKPWMKFDLLPDLVMLENQLPFFILEDLWEGRYPILLCAYCAFWFRIYSQQPDVQTLEMLCKSGSKVKHFVDVIRNVCLQKETKTRGEPESIPSTTQPDQAGVKFEVKCFVDLIRNLCLPKETKSRGKLKSIPSLTQLHQAGVKSEQRSTHELLDIHFDKDKGVLEIPKLNIGDSTEITIRNLVAYEQCHYLEKAYICDYVTLMDGLVNIPEDVGLLGKYEILNNMLGDNSQVSTLINNLGNGIMTDYNNFHFATIRDGLKAYCEKPWHKWKANLSQTYLNTPWAVISVAAGILLLVLTVIQTVFSIISAV